MSTYPLIVGIISLVFGGTVAAQWLGRRRPHQLVWAISLFMAAIGAFAFVGFLANGSETLFRLYYVFGALLMASYLGLGSIYIAAPRRWANLTLAVVVVVSLIGIVLVLTAPINAAALHSELHSGGAGSGVLKTGLWLLPLILLNSFGAAAVIGVALYSAYRVLRRQAPPRFALANITIAVGVAIISAAGSTARLGLAPNAFWAIMAAGWVVTFAGFLLTTNLAALAAPGGQKLPLGRVPV